MQKYLKQGKYTYKQSDILGKGSFGRAYKGYNISTHNCIALKRIQLSNIQPSKQLIKKLLLNEISVMKKCNKYMKINPCLFLVKQFDVFRTDQHLYIVMELCSGGSLENQFRNISYSQYQCVRILYCVIKGLKCMHDMGITHRDLKPDNILISTLQQQKGGEIKIYKIGDFGFAEQKKQFNIAMGTIPYMAPQILKRQIYDQKVDIWSLGIIAYEIMFKKMYFVGRNREEVQQQIKEKPFVLTNKQISQISSNYHDLLVKCLKKNPKQRISIDELLVHPLFKQIHSQLDNIKLAIKEDSKIQSLHQSNSNSSIEQHQKLAQQQSQTCKNQSFCNLLFPQIFQLLLQCDKMLIMAQNFYHYYQQTHRSTQFIQIYLLKNAYVTINLLNYSIVNKKNKIQISKQEFRNLFQFENITYYQEVSEKCNKQCVLISGLFNQKYAQFSSYIKKFSQPNQQLIKTIINEQIQTPIKDQIFYKQLNKWCNVLQTNSHPPNNGYNNWTQLINSCKIMLQLKN